MLLILTASKGIRFRYQMSNYELEKWSVGMKQRYISQNINLQCFRKITINLNRNREKLDTKMQDVSSVLRKV